MVLEGGRGGGAGRYNSAFIPDRGTTSENKWAGWTLYSEKGPTEEIQ